MMIKTFYPQKAGLFLAYFLFFSPPMLYGSFLFSPLVSYSVSQAMNLSQKDDEENALKSDEAVDRWDEAEKQDKDVNEWDEPMGHQSNDQNAEKKAFSFFEKKSFHLYSQESTN